MNLTIRPERKEDYSGINKINNLAFGRENEGELIERLRKTKRFIPELSLVAEYKGGIVGHILFYPVAVNSETCSHISLALAPMSVHPDSQNKGIGSKLVKEGLKVSGQLGYNSVIVLGHSGYYPRFGFEPAGKWSIRAPFDVPDNAFLALELTKDALKKVSGTVEYPEEFNDA